MTGQLDELQNASVLSQASLTERGGRVQSLTQKLSAAPSERDAARATNLAMSSLPADVVTLQTRVADDKIKLHLPNDKGGRGG